MELCILFCFSCFLKKIQDLFFLFEVFFFVFSYEFNNRFPALNIPAQADQDEGKGRMHRRHACKDLTILFIVSSMIFFASFTCGRSLALREVIRKKAVNPSKRIFLFHLYALNEHELKNLLEELDTNDCMVSLTTFAFVEQ